MVLWLILLAIFCLPYRQSRLGAQALSPTHGQVRATYSHKPLARQHVTVRVLGCTDCGSRPPGISIWDESINAPALPVVSARTPNGFTLAISPGYYDINVENKSCNGDRFVGVLPRHDRHFDIHVRCFTRHGRTLGYVRLVDEARGLAGTVPSFATAVTMWPADGNQSPIAATLDGGAYYFDEVNCVECVLQFSLTGGTASRLGVRLRDWPNFSLVRHDVLETTLLQGISVRGSPFNAPETLVEGPSQSVWILDRLGNRVALIAPHAPPREISLPSPFADAGDIIATSRFVWVGERRFDRIVRFALDGSSREYQISLIPGTFHGNLKMVATNKDRIWFIDGGQLGTLDEGLGNPTYFTPSPDFFINALAVGGDGRVWITGTAPSLNGLGKPLLAVVTIGGQWQRFPLSGEAAVIKVARNGLWVATGNYNNYLAFVDWGGHESIITLPIQRVWPTLYTVSSADDLWFSDRYGNIIGRASRDGLVNLTYTDFGPAGISDMRLDSAGNLWIAEPKAGGIEELGKSIYLPPRGVSPKNLLFDSNGNLWYSDPDADVVGVVAKNGRSKCYAFPLSIVRNCAFGHADIVAVSPESKNEALHERARL